MCMRYRTRYARPAKGTRNLIRRAPVVALHLTTQKVRYRKLQLIVDVHMFEFGSTPQLMFVLVPTCILEP